MKLLLSALLLAVVPAVFAQNQPAQPSFPTGVVIFNPGQATVEQMKAYAKHMNAVAIQFACPLFMTSASVAGSAGYLPVGQRRPDDGTLTLHFRNQSGKAIRSASVTATVNVKTNIYDLDAHPIVLQLSVPGTEDVDRDLNQLTQIDLPRHYYDLPRHYYLFGVAQVSLDGVTYADGTNWTAPKQNNYCRVNAQASEKIAR